jgi:hypothetical protein
MRATENPSTTRRRALARIVGAGGTLGAAAAAGSAVADVTDPLVAWGEGWRALFARYNAGDYPLPIRGIARRVG